MTGRLKFSPVFSDIANTVPGVILWRIQIPVEMIISNFVLPEMILLQIVIAA